MDIDDLPARDEGVDRGIVDEDDLDIFRLQPRRFDQRRGHLGQHGLALGIAQDRLRERRARGEDRQRGKREDECQKAVEGSHRIGLAHLHLNGD